MDAYQAFAGKDDSYPDGLILREAIKQLDHLATTKKPFFLATGFIRPHLPLELPQKYLKPYEKISLPLRLTLSNPKEKQLGMDPVNS